MTIGIGLTTHNRYDVFKNSYVQILRHMPKEARLFVVDDASKVPVPEADLRFETNVGIAAAKNACIAALDDCDYIFLFDDDTFCKVPNWHLPYINSGLNHAMMIFPRLANGQSTNNRLIKTVGNLRYFASPCGNMLFFTKEAIQTVGGMDVGYGTWGGEHESMSQRIFNNGLTPHPFIDVKESLSLFYSHDYHLSCPRSVSTEVRKEQIKKIIPKLQSEKKSKEFIPYKEMTGMVITTYFTGFEDPQRGEKWEPNITDIDPLFVSILSHCEKPLVVLTDSFPYLKKGIRAEFVQTECTMNPYLQRWVSILEYIETVKEDYVFCVDATDVEMLRNPFKDNLGNYIWVGDEPSTINNEWLKKHHSQPLFDKFLKTHANKPLLNAGVLGGRTSVVKSFLERMVWYIKNHEILYSDMLLFNFVLYAEFPEAIKHGRECTNVFKSYSVNPKHNSYFKHK